MRLKKGVVYKIKDQQGFEGYGVYMGTQNGFECCICGKGHKTKTFNIIHGNTIQEGLENLNKGDYETFGYGNEHMPELEETNYRE